MMTLLQQRLEAAAKQGLTRTLSPRQGIDLSSSDYLGFSEDLELRERFLKHIVTLPLGTTSSRLLRGNLDLFDDVEKELADFVAREAALLFPSGYQANIALLSSLLSPEDIVFSDVMNHASIIDGIRLSRAEKIIYPHRDLQFLEDVLRSQQKQKRVKLIVTESLFSMEGTIADLRATAELAERYGAYLIVDEAHSTGIWGPSLVATLGLGDRVLATMHGAGKAMGASGAWIASSALVKSYLINFARPLIFSTAPVPAMAILLREAAHYYREVGTQRAASVLARTHHLRTQLKDLVMGDDQSPIVPILIGNNEHALAIANCLREHNWDIRAIRPPTVPTGTARLRVTVKWHNSETELTRFAADLKLLLRKIAK